ncbi:MAG: zinc-dependent alcohol dehydrogenase family protein [Planctomycetes bacterium]|nr:zinc-dependent alcohol dehydrogenase family protein [Planctomycetota bacterium]
MITETRAQVLRRQAPIEERPLEDVSWPRPKPGPGEVLLGVRACGICRTDLHLIEGDLPARRLPIVPGHQIVGIVEEVGPGVSMRKVGDRVGAGWLRSTCGTCDYCRGDFENLCPDARFTGYDADGGYAGAVAVPAAFTYPIPDRFGDCEAAPLLCAGIIGYRSLRLAGVRPGSTVGLFGFGASAHLALQVAVHWGSKVVVITRGSHHQEVARRLGASWAGAPDEPPRTPLDCAVVFAPAGTVVREALAAVRPGGTVAVNAIHLDRLPEMPYRLLYGERSLRSVTNFTRRDAEEFLALAASIGIRVEIETYPPTAANEALTRMKRRELRAAAVLAV